MSQPVKRKSRKGRGSTARSAEKYRLRINNIVQQELDDDLSAELKAMQDRWNQYLASQQAPVNDDDTLESISILFDSFEVQVPVSHQTVEYVRRKVVSEQPTHQMQMIASTTFDNHTSSQSLANSVVSSAPSFNVRRCQHGTSVRVNTRTHPLDHSQCRNIYSYLIGMKQGYLNPMLFRNPKRNFVHIKCAMEPHHLQEVQSRLCSDRVCHVVAIIGTSSNHPVLIGPQSMWYTKSPLARRLALPITPLTISDEVDFLFRQRSSWSELQFNIDPGEVENLTSRGTLLKYGQCCTAVFGYCGNDQQTTNDGQLT